LDVKEKVEKLVEIEQLAAMVADQDLSLRHAMNEVRDEGAAVLKTLVEGVREALPMICSSIAIAVDVPYEARHETPPKRTAAWKAFRVAGDGPKAVSGRELGTIGGSALYLREDGAFVRFDYRGHESARIHGRIAWEATVKTVTLAEVAASYDVNEILGTVAEGLTQQLCGRKDEHTEALLTTAQRFRAVSLLLKAVR
jgi:hypothetical protein